MTRRCRLLMLSSLLLVCAVGHAAGPRCHAVGPEGEQPRAVALRALACEAQSHRLVLLGELHGTAESPALLADLLRAQPATRPIRLGLEWPVALQDKVDAYFRSAGTAADRAAFAASYDWTWYDGRMSRAWLGLLDTLRALRRSGRDVRVFTMEPSYGSPAEMAAAGGFLKVKEGGMARAIAAQLRQAPPGALVAALVGNYHVRIGTADHASSLAYRLAGDHPMLLLPQSRHGTFWATVPPATHAAVQTIHGAGARIPAHDVIVQTDRAVLAGVTVVSILVPAFTASPHP